MANLYPGYFALVMATGICSTALREVGQPAASAALLAVAVTCFAVLLVALGWRLVRYPRRVLADLAAPDRAFAYFTLVAASNVLAARLAADGHRHLAVALAAGGAVVWLGLTYTVPARLILGPRPQPVLAGVNGTWFIWVVGTQSTAIAAAVLAPSTAGGARAAALTAVLMWSVGVVLYLIVATVLVTRLLLMEVQPRDLTPPYWVTMGATAITVFAAARILDMPSAPAVTAARPVLAGLGLVLWAFGTWLIPMLVTFGVWRHVRHRVRLGYLPALWSIVFPLGMYAVASMQLGAVVGLPIVARIGRAWTWLAVAVWAVVFAAMCVTLLRPALRRTRRPSSVASGAGRRQGPLVPAGQVPYGPAVLPGDDLWPYRPAVLIHDRGRGLSTDAREGCLLTATATFTDIFRQEHRAVRDLLFDLIDAFRARDTVKARALLVRIAALTGPHFRYEEESLYPSLVDVFGPDYVGKLLDDHDGAVRTARRLVQLASLASLTDAQVQEAVAGARSILPHVSDCDGLSIMVERFPDERVGAILDTRQRALEANVDLLTWAATIRDRTV